MNQIEPDLNHAFIIDLNPEERKIEIEKMSMDTWTYKYKEGAISERHIELAIKRKEEGLHELLLAEFEVKGKLQILRRVYS